LILFYHAFLLPLSIFAAESSDKNRCGVTSRRDCRPTRDEMRCVAQGCLPVFVTHCVVAYNWDGMDEALIAPCGMNCGVCSGYLALEHDVRSQGIRMPYCGGCRPRDKKCAFLKKRCSLLLNGEVKYCYECKDFPCRELIHIDRRYRNLYRMSMIENLEFIRENGIGELLEKEEERWRCPRCGGVICCHNGICFDCGLDELRTRKKLYRWEDD